jgi:hypothetical protein
MKYVVEIRLRHSDADGGIHIQTQRLMGRIYEVRR